MNLDFDETQSMLRTQAREFITEKCPPRLVKEIITDEKGYSEDFWRSIGELGWLGIPFAEKYGGVDMSFFEVLLLMEEMGRGAVPSPYLSTIVCGMAINEFGSEQQKQEILPKIASGEIICSLAWTEPNASLEPGGVTLKASKGAGPKYGLVGTKLFCPDAHIADKLLVVARTEAATKEDPAHGISIFITTAKSDAVVCYPQPTTGFDNQAQIEFVNLVVSEEDILGELNRGWGIVEAMLNWGALGKSAEMLGASAKALEMSVDYAKDRKQYGKHIGSYQAQQHRLADMWIAVESSRDYYYEVGWRFSHGENDPVMVSKVKAMMGDMAEDVTDKAIRLHGAIGLTWDYDLGLYFRRVRGSSMLFGDPSYHKRKLIDLIAERLS